MGYLEYMSKEFRDTEEQKLEEIIDYFKSNEEPITISLIQRQFCMGYCQAFRALHQIKQRIK